MPSAIGWPTISVKLVGNDLPKYRIHTRDGYRLEQIRAVEQDLAQSVRHPTTIRMLVDEESGAI